MAIFGALLTGALLAGCSGSGASPLTPPPSASAAVPAPSGSASPTALSAAASPAALPVIGSRSNGSWTFVLNAVRQAGPGQVLVEGSLTSHHAQALYGFEEPGYARLGTSFTPSFEFSAVSVLAPGDTTVYQPVRDAANECACTARVNDIVPEQPYAVYTVMTAPMSVSTVTVVVRGFAPFANVPVTP